MNTLNSTAIESNKFIYLLTDKLNLKNVNKNMALANLSIYYTLNNLKSEYNNNKLMISALTWNYELNLPYGSYSVLDIEDFFDNPPVQIDANKIKNRTVFKIKRGSKLELLSKETMQLLGSSNKDIDENKDREIVPKLEIVEVVLLHCNLVNSHYQQTSKTLYTFVPNNQFGELIAITPHSPTMLKTTNAEFSFIEIWFTDQNNRPLKIEDNVNITLISRTA